MRRLPASQDGSLHVDLQATEAGWRARIASERPVMACRVFEGRALSNVLQIVPLLFSVCSLAQSVAAVRAAERALGLAAGTRVQQHRDMLLVMETLREHLWRFFIDWPRCLGLGGDAQAFAPLNQKLLQLAEALNHNKQLTGKPGLTDRDAEFSTSFARDWQKLRPALLRSVFGREMDARSQLYTLDGDSAAGSLVQYLIELGYAGTGQHRLDPLPTLPDRELMAILSGKASESFACFPQWDGHCYETGAHARLARHPLTRTQNALHGDGAASRMTARLAEIMTLSERIDAGCAGASLLLPRSSGYQPDRIAERRGGKLSCGMAQVEAARGRLLHYLETEGEIVTRYRIVAPTEWNFHPDGILGKMLSSLPAAEDDELLRQARLLVCLVDPCVSCNVTIHRDRAKPAVPVVEASHA